jgi:hypothetical protein
MVKISNKHINQDSPSIEEYEDIYADEFDISENGERGRKRVETKP